MSNLIPFDLRDYLQQVCLDLKSLGFKHSAIIMGDKDATGKAVGVCFALSGVDAYTIHEIVERAITNKKTLHLREDGSEDFEERIDN